MACGLWPVACGLWRVACGLWPVACGLPRFSKPRLADVGALPVRAGGSRCTYFPRGRHRQHLSEPAVSWILVIGTLGHGDKAGTIGGTPAPAPAPARAEMEREGRALEGLEGSEGTGGVTQSSAKYGFALCSWGTNKSQESWPIFYVGAQFDSSFGDDSPSRYRKGGRGDGKKEGAIVTHLGGV